jgi:ABC-type spermidine/putrescine transport system permease subunit I
MLLNKLKSPEGKKFLLSVLIVFLIALTILIRATIGGVIEEYNMPFSEWTMQMFILQGAMVIVYTTVITLIFSLPLAFYFLGEKDNH